MNRGLLVLLAEAKAGRTYQHRAGETIHQLGVHQVRLDRGVRISMDGKGWYQDNIFVGRLWRTVKHEEVYLKADASVLEAQKGLED